ncbi:MAG: Holliday junction resolvase RuvX [Negativicutes bacterium]|nr:Holliday junction resolvase RuvX [Negativicutes bacterium]
MTFANRLMGLDVGSHTIGVAVSDLLGITAQGVEVIRRSDPEQDFKRLQELVEQFAVTAFVVGLPKNMDNSIGPQGVFTQEFAAQLAERFALPVLFWDERLTTKSARQFLISADVSRKKRKQVIDKLAAALILQSYMDSL